MKVLHVISDKNIGGAGVLLCNILRHLDRTQFESTVALPAGSLLEARIRALSVRTIALEHPCERLSRASVSEIEDVIRRSGADLVHANAAICARVAGKRAGVGVLFTRHCCYPPSGIWRLPPVRWLGGALNRSLCDCAIATATAAADNLRSYGIPTQKIRVVINGSEPIREVSREELQAFRARFGIRESDYVIGICARLEACKGHDVFLRAAQRLMCAMPQIRFRFLIVGNGSKEEYLRTLVNTLGLEESVCFTGFLTDMAPVYRLLRINVNCSRGTETSCLALSEGMSAGVPMVVSDYGGNPAMIGESLAGFLFRRDDDAMLAKVLGRIVANPILEARMREAARKRYEACYTCERMTRRISDVYRELQCAGKKH